MSENVGASTSHNPKGLHSLYRDEKIKKKLIMHRCHIVMNIIHFLLYIYFGGHESK
jgi:hypothetical protein